MSLFLTAVLIIGGIVAAVVLAVGVPVLFGVMAFDVAKARKTAPVAERRPSSVRIAVERGVARAFVIAGGLFWSMAAFAGLYSYQQTGTSDALLAGFIPLAAVTATLIVGWYFERSVSVMLALASFAVVAWGVIYQFEAGVWAIMTFALIGPMLTASVLFWMARREQEAYELETATRPELSFAFSARSSITA